MEAASSSSRRPVRGSARLLRGVLSAALAVSFAAAAHTVAGHHAPHAVVIVLAMAVSVPLCTALSGVRLSRSRLAAAVLSSQMLLHGLFQLFPAQQAATGLAGAEELSTHGHHGPGAPLSLTVDPQAHSHTGLSHPEVAMIAAHLAAALLTYGLLRRGETLLCALAALVTLVPALMLLAGFRILTDDLAFRRFPVAPVRHEADVWNGAGPRTLRGPPAFDLAC